MAYNFTGATLLDYKINKNYLGEGLYTLNTTKNISIEGIFLNLQNVEGVTDSITKTKSLLNGIVNKYDAVIINGYNFGTGKVLNLSFPEKNPIRVGKYIYDIEILDKSDFSNAPNGDIYGTYFSGVSDKITSLDENINFDYAENGDYSYNHDIDIQYYDTGNNSNLFTKSKDFANSEFYDTLNIGLIGPFSGFYNTLKNKKNYFAETYDLINKRCKFSKKILVNKNYYNNYTTTLNHTLNFEANGKITVQEQGVIKALDNTLDYTAENYFQNAINGGNLPDKIFLEGWANDQSNIDINGAYVYTKNNGIIGNRYIRELPYLAYIYFNTSYNSWVHESSDFGWVNVSTNPNVLPLNGWTIYNGLGAAGTIKADTSYLRCQNVYNTYLEKNSNIGGVCGFRKTSKLNQIGGSNAPIGALFNNIAFNYDSFASNCSLLGLNPTTILNSLGGVDFSYNYVVMRAKTSSNFSNDSISDLGNGIINITTVGPSIGAILNRYRFFVMCREGWTTVRFYGTDYDLEPKDSLYNQPFNLGKTANPFTNSLEYSISYVNDPSFEGNIINTYDITLSKDMQDVVTYSEQGELTQVGQIGDIKNLNLIKTKYQAAKTRASTSYPSYKLKNSSFSAGSLGVDYIYKIVISDETDAPILNGTYLRSAGGPTKFIGPARNDGLGPPGYSLYPEIYWDAGNGWWALAYLGEIDGEIAFISYDLINWETYVYIWDGNATAYKTTYNNNFSYSIEKTSDSSILEGHPLYKSLTFKIDDQTPTDLYKEYVIPNRDIKNMLFLSGNQVEIGNKSIAINGTLVRPTTNFWQTPITFPLNDLKSKSISGAFDLVSTEAFIDGTSYEYDSDNNFSFNLNIKYLKKI